MAEADFASIPGFELTETITAGFSQDAIHAPTEVQVLGIAAVLSGSHVVLESGTGTGKTLAYVLPLLQLLRQNPQRRVLCIAPSTELAVQVKNVVRRYAGPDFRVALLTQGGNPNRQRAELTQKTRFIVGTAGRVAENLDSDKLRGITHLVFDEPEPILTQPQGAFILNRLTQKSKALRWIMVGATLGKNAEKWLALAPQEELARVSAKDDPLKTKIRHFWVKVKDPSKKDYQLLQLLRKHSQERVVVFVNQPKLLGHLYRKLSDAGLGVDSVSKERSKLENERAVRKFRAGTFNVLIMTDQSATGMDFEDVEWVLHFEPPVSANAYVHRAGRTGRRNKTGASVLFIEEKQRHLARIFGNELGITFEEL